MATSKNKSIPALFQASKRLRANAGVNALRDSNNGVIQIADEVFKPGSPCKVTKEGSAIAKASEASDLYPLPGFEPPPFRRLQRSNSDKEDTAPPVQEHREGFSGQMEASQLSKEQQMRMELNKGVAQAKRNLRMCEEVVTESLRLGNALPDFQNLLVEKSWLGVLMDEFTKQYMNTLHTFVGREFAGKQPIYPPPALIFNAFNTCPFHNVKVVVIGQDPYHGPGQAMGLSFSVPAGTKVPSSLLNIFKEISEDVGCKIPSHGNLEKWAHQGVLLLNTVLTVREHHANSHAKKGWEPFTDAAIRAISQGKGGVVFLLWGNSAHEKTRLIDNRKHHILKAAHPSGLSAHKGFFKCRHFSKTNQILEKSGQLPIDWQL